MFMSDSNQQWCEVCIVINITKTPRQLYRLPPLPLEHSHISLPHLHTECLLITHLSQLEQACRNDLRVVHLIDEPTLQFVYFLVQVF